MTRYHATPEGNVPFSPEEEAEWDAQVAEYEAGADARAAEAVRKERDGLLDASDWTQMPDYSSATKESWATYRQALRDIPDQTGFPNTIDWPTSP
tara:strand:- start:4 stop:288 length:285 start_codon:yes stop_codon:yes gene_type:complete